MAIGNSSDSIVQNSTAVNRDYDTKCFMFGYCRYVITTKTMEHYSRSAEGQISLFAIDFDGRPYNTHTTVWVCDVFTTCQPTDNHVRFRNFSTTDS